MRNAILIIWVGLLFGCATPSDQPRPGEGQSPVALESRGYVRTEATGVWKYGFERSEFRPTDRGNEKWWLSLPNGWWEQNKSSPLMRKGIHEDGTTVLVSGFLSPKGQFGHLGAYDREFVAETVKEMETPK